MCWADIGCARVSRATQPDVSVEKVPIAPVLLDLELLRIERVSPPSPTAALQDCVYILLAFVVFDLILLWSSLF